MRRLFPLRFGLVSQQKLLTLVLSVIFLSVVSCSKSKNSITPIVPITPTPPPPTSTVIPPINTNSTTAKEIIKDMSGGFNLGNTFDLQSSSNSPTLTAIKPIIDLYYDAGMRHIRIPVTWTEGFTSNIADANGNVNYQNSRFLELKAVIDYALSKKMYVEINAHHEHNLKNNYDGSAVYNNKFKTLWTGIATYFKDYPKQLIFDVLNEPDGALGQWSGNGAVYPLPTNPNCLALTRQLNKVAYDAIRAVGGGNTTRIIMVEPNGQGNQGMIEETYPDKASLPGGGTDAYLAIQVHSYDPWAFCGETGSNSAFPGSSTISNAINKVALQSTILDVPINYGEFGVGRKTGTERNTDLVRGYYKTVKTATLAQNMSYTVWDDRGWFALIAANGNGGYTFTNNIVPSMFQ
nr:glycoside hydrolase family 5 protein [uncultured Pedobacter sp.]